MVTTIDDKGKVFTPKVSKIKIEVIVQTTAHQITGFLHIHPETRMKDELDETSQFVALTDTQVLDDHGKIRYSSNFMIINRSQIIWIIPIAEMKSLVENK